VSELLFITTFVRLAAFRLKLHLHVSKLLQFWLSCLSFRMFITTFVRLAAFRLKFHLHCSKLIQFWLSCLSFRSSQPSSGFLHFVSSFFFLSFVR
jgi:hypothetical protein